MFGEYNLPPISTNASPADIIRWKKNPSVKRCYENLHNPIDKHKNESVSFILRIIERVFIDSKKTTDVLVAYAMSVCDSFLDPSSESIQVTESMVKNKIEEYLVSFAILCR